jgi:hypothetical protein
MVVFPRLLAIGGRTAERAVERDGACLLVALGPTNIGRLPGVLGDLRAARASVHQAVHEGHRALPPSGCLYGHHPEGAECVVRTIWRREPVENRFSEMNVKLLMGWRSVVSVILVLAGTVFSIIGIAVLPVNRDVLLSSLCAN